MQVLFGEDLSKAIDREKDLLDAMPLPGTRVDEAERRRAWITLPLRVRTAIRRMHRQFWTPIFNCSGADFACCSGSSRIHSGVPSFSMRYL